jgi:predicted ATPase/GAF domain-containing protein
MLGRDEASRSRVLVLAPAVEYPRPHSLKRLEHECSLKENLDPGWAARPIGLARHWDGPVVVLEDPGGKPLDQFGGSGETHPSGPQAHALDLGFCLRVGINLANAIGHLHRRGIVHKDIKPANVLVNSATGQVWLMGFGIASRLPRERQSPEPPEFLEGTLAYMAPEQTGRMNRSVDSRSDFYSLGITLYQMLTGSLPFTASDPMEWVHCHIARKPAPPSERLENVPAAVSAIIMKLLAKTADERYQTAAGVESDLRRCLAEWETRCRIDEFPLGEHDVPDRLLIPEKLYGRASETEIRLACFDRVVASGMPELVLVCGYSGIGKSSVVNELHKVLVPPRGLFASGKFDQYKRDIPYATLAQAIQSLVRPFLSKSETELRIWRDAFRHALGPNGLLIVDLVPELKLIIGEQQPVPELPAQDAQRRFQLVFRRFLSVFARPEHPLALFLDDLQWLDAATLDLLEDLLTQPDVRHLMLIGAYRDNEVDATHPLMRKLEGIRRAGPAVQEIVLAPLAREDMGRLIADALHCGPERATPLAQVVHEKTAGNPFFAIQLISALAEEGLLAFDHCGGRWDWDLSRIRVKGYTDNVVNLMVGKLNRLPLETQQALQEFACLGNSAETTTLSIVHGTSEGEVHSDLWEAVRLEFIVRLESSYKFVHDRVQEAAYSLISEELRAEAHLRIGRLLAAHTPPEKREKAIFEIVNQVNRGAALITSQEERDQIAELNLIAGKRAKASTAYASALKYLIAGAALLADDCWERRHELTFALELQRAECEFLTGELVAAADRLTMLSSRAANTVEKATAACLRVDVYTTLDQSDRAVGICLDYLRHSGVEWSPHPTKEEARREYERIWSQLGSRAIEELIELPLMSDAASLATLDVLTKLVPPALYTDANLVSLASCRAVNLSLERGNSDGSCVAYVWLGTIAGPHFDASLQAQRLLWTSPSLFETAEYHFYGALSHAACCDSAFPDRYRQRFEALTLHYRQLEIWAENCAENFENRAALVGAEIARIEGRDLNAMRLYEQAIRSARANGFIQNEALAYELAARFYVACGFEDIADLYLRKARYCYLRWGADGKVRQLDEFYPNLRGKDEPIPRPTSTIGASVEHLDLATVIKVSQTVSGEIVLEKLIDTLMRTAIEHAGAERGLLILPRGVEQRIEAEATTSCDTIVVRLLEALVSDAVVPASIVHYVARTQESVILDDASAQNPFAADAYFRQEHARSILCLPLINQRRLIGVLYMENNLAPRVFTPTRIAVLKLLAAQAAISLENTRLYRDLEAREAKIRRLVEANVVGIVMFTLEGAIIEANEAFLHLVQYGREDIVSGRVRSRGCARSSRRFPPRKSSSI